MRLVMIYVSMLLVAGLSIFISINVQKHSTCQVINSVVDTYHANPPKGVLGQGMQSNYEQLKKQLGC